MADVGKFFGSLFGSAAGGVASPAAGIVEGASKIIGMFKLSPEVKATLAAQLTAENIDLEKAELAAQVATVQGQLEINKEEAASTSWFISGWRPAVGWVCVIALAYAYVVQPFAEFSLVVFKVTISGTLPHLDTGAMISGLLIPLLGIAGLRTIEKVTNTEGNR
jgi:predicted polyphosphate/ATP-dependent NAD kinase